MLEFLRVWFFFFFSSLDDFIHFQGFSYVPVKPSQIFILSPKPTYHSYFIGTKNSTGQTVYPRFTLPPPNFCFSFSALHFSEKHCCTPTQVIKSRVIFNITLSLLINYSLNPIDSTTDICPQPSFSIARILGQANRYHHCLQLAPCPAFHSNLHTVNIRTIQPCKPDCVTLEHENHSVISCCSQCEAQTPALTHSSCTILAFLYILQHVQFLTILVPLHMLLYLEYPSRPCPSTNGLIFK